MKVNGDCNYSPLILILETGVHDWSASCLAALPPEKERPADAYLEFFTCGGGFNPESLCNLCVIIKIVLQNRVVSISVTL